MISTLVSVLLSLLLLAPAFADELPGDMPLTSAFAEKLVSEQLHLAGSDGFKVTISRPRLPLGNQEARPTRIEIDGLRHDPASGRFSAVMIGTVGDQPRFELPMEGRVQPLVSVPILARAVQRGDLISAADLDWKMVVPDALSNVSLTDEAQLIGAEARRRLSPGRVLTSRDVGPPRLVLRGKPVRVVYADDGLKLTALGTARDDGAFGEPVRVINPESRLEVQGIATGHQEVTVGKTVMPGASF
ncbi:MAG: flagellar basal body P-ring formation chaperone FlgA [Alphaproteobacteria bacterium]|nr:flagellar basal body P-ring formation chaperone FlgA [Alphaproteobacteria bacterium]